MIGCGGADIVEESKCGDAVPAVDSATLIKVIKEKVLTDKESFAKMGLNGREYYERNYRLDLCIDNLEKIIDDK